MSETHASKALALALVGAPILWLGAEAVSPKLDQAAGDQLKVIAAHQDRWYGYTMLLALGTMLLVPAIAGIVRLTRERSTRLTYLGAALLGFGTLVAIGDATTQLVVWQMVGPKADRSQMAALLDRFDNAGGAGVFFGPGGIAFLVGTLLLSVAMVRTPELPRWAAVLFGVGLIVQLVGFSASSVPIIAVSGVLSLASMAAIARSLLGVSAESAHRATARPGIGAQTVPS
ncbi:MAG TPA: hypothetical protein VJ831_07885 [Jatrophihabitantaceae bacterium]|nr:hypothetical protein [Jatrophihabitantaceae bacterium]